MCLGIPGRVVEWLNRDPIFAKACVGFGGTNREIHMACVTEAKVNDYVIVHAGIAICIVDQAEAQKTLDELDVLKELGLDEESTP